MKIQIPKLFLLASLLIWWGCDTIEDKKGRFLLKGNKKMEENDPKTALGFYEEALALDSNFVDAYYNKGMAHIRLNQLEAAIQDFSIAIQKKPDYTDALFQRGLAYLDLGANYNAKEDAARMVTQNPTDWRSFFLKGLTEEKQKSYAEALQSFQKAADLDSKNSDLLVNQATIHF
ncbi:MAG: tetratricopeptide repeat protein [Algoriphagus sp.]